MTKTGILLLNLGGPRNLKEVKPFLYRLFSDPAILVGVPAPLRQALAFLIAQIKGPSSIRNYRLIGGGSPILHWTLKQAEGLERALARNAFKVRAGFLIGSPSILSALTELREWEAERILLLPLFPQFSTTTTLSCFKAVERSLNQMKWNPPVLKVENFSDHPLYISLLQKTIAEALESFSGMRPKGASGDYFIEEAARSIPGAHKNDPIHILFSAHSLPLSIVKRGDPYPEQIQETVQALVKDLKHPWSLAFQSRNGPLPWLRPYVEEELERLGRAQVRSCLVVPVSFVSDHIETLWEIDCYYAKIARAKGIVNFFRSRSFNDDFSFIEVLKALVCEAMAGNV